MLLLSLPTLLILAYLLGSIPTSVWVSKWVFGKDIRHYGSGNAGATNSFRYLGGRWAAFILSIDILKGMGAVLLLLLLPEPVQDGYWGRLNNQLLLGMAAILGHVFPIFAGFKGGKGVATFLGVMIAIGPLFAIVALATFALIYFLCNYVALASMAGALSFTIFIMLSTPKDTPYYPLVCGLAIFGSVLLIYKHRKNIRNLIHKREDKTYFFKKSKKDFPQETKDQENGGS